MANSKEARAAQTQSIDEAMKAAQDQFGDEVFDFEGDEEQIGFPPYWKPEAGRRLKAMVVGLEEPDATFDRFVLRAAHSVRCQRGPAEKAAEVQIKPGQFFTMSVYSGLPLQKYIGYEVQLEATEKEENVTKDGHPMWRFRLILAPKVKALFEASQERKRLKQAEDAEKGVEGIIESRL